MVGQIEKERRGRERTEREREVGEACNIILTSIFSEREPVFRHHQQ